MQKKSVPQQRNSMPGPLHNHQIVPTTKIAANGATVSCFQRSQHNQTNACDRVNRALSSAATTVRFGARFVEKHGQAQWTTGATPAKATTGALVTRPFQTLSSLSWRLVTRKRLSRHHQRKANTTELLNTKEQHHQRLRYPRNDLAAGPRGLRTSQRWTRGDPTGEQEPEPARGPEKEDVDSTAAKEAQPACAAGIVVTAFATTDVEISNQAIAFFQAQIVAIDSPQFALSSRTL